MDKKTRKILSDTYWAPTEEIKMGWFLVKNELPPDDEKVICLGCSGIFIGYYYHQYEYWASDKYEHCECTQDFEPVTHWMPLPQPPKEWHDKK